MDERRDGDQARRELLAFVERHWRELTLRDARSLCLDIVDSAAASNIKASLTYR